MRPLSLVPIRTLPPCGEAATANAVTLVELQRPSEPPSAAIRKTALRAFCNSLRLRAPCAGCVPNVAVGVPLSSTLVTVPVTVPPDVLALTFCDDCADDEVARGLVAA